MSNAFQFCLKGFKLKMMVVESKIAQLVESNEEPVYLFSSIDQKMQKLSLSSRTLIQPIEFQSRGGQGPMVTYQELNVNG